MRFAFSILVILLGSCSIQSEEKSESVVTNAIADSSTITCPHCSFTKVELLPTEYCLFRYECENCGKNITPKDGDCCVFCSYGTYKCPSIQEEELGNDKNI